MHDGACRRRAKRMNLSASLSFFPSLFLFVDSSKMALCMTVQIENTHQVAEQTSPSFVVRFHFIILSVFGQNFVLWIFPLPQSISIFFSYLFHIFRLTCCNLFFYPSPFCKAEELPFFLSSHMLIHLYQDTSPFITS